jgi:rRNA-processing protein FCF1
MNFGYINMKVLLDTNFLLVPVQFKVDIYEELRGNQLLTLDKCVKELQTKKGFAVAKVLMKKNHVKVVKGGAGGTDMTILTYVKKHKNVCVATNDKELIKALKSIGISIIRLRQKKYLVME